MSQPLKRWSPRLLLKVTLLSALLALLAVFVLPGVSSTLQSFSVAQTEHQDALTAEKPAVIESKPLRFVAFGDSGSGLSGQMKVARAMVRQHDKTPFDMALMLGDNIYHDGNIKKHGQERFTIPYKTLLEQDVRFLPTLGNHDVLAGYERDQIAFFKMPGYYYEFASGPVRFFVLNTNQFNLPQQVWLKERLSKTTEPWKIVYGHHPVYSSGAHGSSQALIRDLKPILENHGVNLYLSGHDHNYERFAPVNGVHYIVSGGAGASLRQFGNIQKGSLVRYSVYHFLLFELKDNDLWFTAFDADGNSIDKGKIPPSKSS